MKKYIVGIPNNYDISLAVDSESNDAAEKYAWDLINKYDLRVMAIDESGNYIEVGDLRIVRNEWADILNPLIGEPIKRTERPGQKIVNRYQLTSSSRVEVDSLGNQILYSYSTPVIMKEPNGKLHRLWGGWTRTTGKHIQKFCGIYKSELDKLEVEDLL